MTNAILRNKLSKSSDNVILMDGGMGSAIEDRGISVRSAMWGSYCFVETYGREVNDQVHREYIAAGAEILITNTHNVRRSKCAEFLTHIDIKMLPEHITDVPDADRPSAFHQWIHDLAVESARRAIPNGADIAVASCVGSVEPLGPYAQESQISSEEACRRLEPELLLRRRAGVDLIIFETLTTRSEIEGVARLSHEHDLGDFAVGLTCGPDGKTLAGVSMQEAVDLLGEARPLVFFIQCTPFQHVQPALRQLVAALGPEQYAGVYANDGRVWKDRRWHGERTTPQRYAEEASAWKQIGARVIGGCCGTGPAHISALQALCTR